MTADYSPVAPSIDVPTVSAPTSLTSTAATHIVGSAGWLTPKRTGVAEQAAGDTTGSANGPDRTGSTRYTYPGTGTPIAYAAQNRYVATDYKPGSTAALQAARWLFTADFYTDADSFEMRWQTNSATPGIFLMVVNGLRIGAAGTITSATGLTAGSGYGTLVTFPSAATRHIQLYGINSAEGRFGGIAVPSGYTVWKPTTQGRTIAFVGDSYVNGSGVVGPAQTWAWQTGLRLGAETIIQAGIGSTGFAATLTGQPTSNFAGRASMVLAENPNVVVIAGGRNDASGNQAAIESCIQDYLTGGISASNIYVAPTCSESTQAAVRTDIVNACAAKGVRFLDLAVDTYSKLGDGIHMTLAEHQRFGDVAASLAQAQTSAITLSLTPSTAQVEREVATGSIGVTLTATATAMPAATATGNAPLTVTPTSVVVEVESATGTASLAMTPSAAPVEREIATGGAPLTVTPSVVVVEAEVATGGIALAIDANGDANAAGGSPSRGAETALTLTPAASAFATLTTSGTASLSVTPAVVSFEAELATGTASVSIAASVASAEVEIATGVAALALTVTAAAIEREIADGTATLTLTPAAAVTAVLYAAGSIALHLAVTSVVSGVTVNDGVPVANPALTFTLPSSGLALTTVQPTLELTGA